MKSILFATPACISQSEALSCKSYITSVVYNDDVVPTISEKNFKRFAETLEHINGSIKASGVLYTKSEANTIIKDCAEFDFEAKNTDLFVPGQVIKVFRLNE